MSDRAPERLDPDELAAYIDGRLTGEREARVEEALARDGDDYEIFLSSIAFLQQEQSPPAAAVSRTERWWKRRPLYVAVPLAAAALLVFIALPILEPDDPGGVQVADLALDLAPGADLVHLFGENWLDPGWSDQRGPAEALNSNQRIFRLGVYVVDLDATLHADDRESARVVVARIVDLASAENLSAIASTYRTLATRLADTPREELLQLAETGKTFLEEDVDIHRFSFARWIESGRLATLAGDPDPLTRPAFRDFLDQLPEDTVDESLQRHVNELRILLAADAPALAALERAFTAIVESS